MATADMVIHLTFGCGTITITLVLPSLSFVEHSVKEMVTSVGWRPKSLPCEQCFCVVTPSVVTFVNDICYLW